MDNYEVIYSYLQEAVNNDVYTEEFANEILELAYNKYITEGNAYNKVANNLKDRMEEVKKSEEIIDNLDDKINTDQFRNNLRNTKKKLKKEIENFEKDTECQPNKNIPPIRNDLNKYKKRGSNNPQDLTYRYRARDHKRAWMRNKGDN